MSHAVYAVVIYTELCSPIFLLHKDDREAQGLVDLLVTPWLSISDRVPSLLSAVVGKCVRRAA